MTNHTLAAKLLGCEVNALEESGLCRTEELPVLIQASIYQNDGDFQYETAGFVSEIDPAAPVEDKWVMCDYGSVTKIENACPHGAVVIG